MIVALPIFPGYSDSCFSEYCCLDTAKQDILSDVSRQAQIVQQLADILSYIPDAEGKTPCAVTTYGAAYRTDVALECCRWVEARLREAVDDGCRVKFLSVCSPSGYIYDDDYIKADVRININRLCLKINENPVLFQEFAKKSLISPAKLSDSMYYRVSDIEHGSDSLKKCILEFVIRQGDTLMSLSDAVGSMCKYVQESLDYTQYVSAPKLLDDLLHTPFVQTLNAEYIKQSDITEQYLRTRKDLTCGKGSDGVNKLNTRGCVILSELGFKWLVAMLRDVTLTDMLGGNCEIEEEQNERVL